MKSSEDSDWVETRKAETFSMPMKLLVLCSFLCVALTVIAVVHEDQEITYRNSTYDQRLITAGLEWVRVQEILKFQTVVEAAATNEVPKDAVNLSDFNDGYAGYDVNRWRPDSDVRISGGPEVQRRWPDLNFVPDKDQFLGARRAGERRELLIVHFKTPEGQAVDYTAPDEKTWLGFQIDKPYAVSMTHGGTVLWDTLTRLDEK